MMMKKDMKFWEIFFCTVKTLIALILWKIKMNSSLRGCLYPRSGAKPAAASWDGVSYQHLSLKLKMLVQHYSRWLQLSLRGHIQHAGSKSNTSYKSAIYSNSNRGVCVCVQCVRRWLITRHDCTRWEIWQTSSVMVAVFKAVHTFVAMVDDA